MKFLYLSSDDLDKSKSIVINDSYGVCELEINYN